MRADVQYRDISEVHLMGPHSRLGNISGKIACIEGMPTRKVCVKIKELSSAKDSPLFVFHTSDARVPDYLTSNPLFDVVVWPRSERPSYLTLTKP